MTQLTILPILTNEERRVSVYTNNGTPAIADQVTSDTSINELNLNWTEKDLPQKERTKHVHGLHPYLGKFVPQIVEIFLRKYFKAGQTVLDPFVGSGTTLVQANELGIDAIGYDISAFNVLLSKVKTSTYDVKKARHEARELLSKMQLATQPVHGQLRLSVSPVTPVAIAEVANQYLQDWYAPQALDELLTYRYFLETGDYEYTDLLKIILSRSARSARLTTHFDLDFPKQPQTEPYWCYKHSRTCQPTQEAYKFLHRYTTDTLERIAAFARVRTNACVRVCHADSRQAEIEAVDGIITSPPYVGLIDYHEQHAYAYHLLGLVDNRHREIGPAILGAGQEARRQYQENIAVTLRNATHQLRKGGKVIVVAGDRHNLYPQIAQMSGLEQETELRRHVNRRTGRRSGEFFESIFIWRKP